MPQRIWEEQGRASEILEAGLSLRLPVRMAVAAGSQVTDSLPGYCCAPRWGSGSEVTTHSTPHSAVLTDCMLCVQTDFPDLSALGEHSTHPVSPAHSLLDNSAGLEDQTFTSLLTVHASLSHLCCPPPCSCLPTLQDSISRFASSDSVASL